MIGLAGIVEIDGTYLGGLEEGVRGRQTEKKALIVVAAQEDGQVSHPSVDKISVAKIS